MMTKAISRVEVIDGSGRLLVKYGKFKLDFQDDSRTLKVFSLCVTQGCDKLSEDKVNYCETHSPYFSGGEREDKPTEKIGGIKI